MKKKKYLHTQFVKFLLESDRQAQIELDELEIENDEEMNDEEIVPDKKGYKMKEVENSVEVDEVDEDDEEMNADKVIEKLIQHRNKVNQEYGDILHRRTRK
jgi:hypothetical protein